MNKKVYSAPEAEIEKFTDIAFTITTSNGLGDMNNGSGEGGGLDGAVF